jgi:hypothetical protein
MAGVSLFPSPLWGEGCPQGGVRGKYRDVAA